MYSTPSFSNAFTNKSEAFNCLYFFDVNILDFRVWSSGKTIHKMFNINDYCIYFGIITDESLLSNVLCQKSIKLFRDVSKKKPTALTGNLFATRPLRHAK